MKVTLTTALKAGVAPMVLGAAMLSTTAFAQDAKPEAKDEAPSTIVVTGSILRRTNTETVSPVATVTAEQLDQRGISTVQEGLQTLASNNGPALTNSFTANGAFAAGASAVSLRGLSTNSTLVLFDGLRAAYYPLADDGTRNFVDLNTIPDDIIEKVDVLKDGASSAYGADAIAGVVNIKTKRQFKGFAVRAEGGISSRGDAGSQRLSVTLGKGDIEENGYNAYVSGFYYHSAALYNNARDGVFGTADLRSIGGPNNQVAGVGSSLSSPNAYTYGTPTSSIFMVRPYDATNTTAQAARWSNLNTNQCSGSSLYTLTASELAANATAPTTVCSVDYTQRYGVIQPELSRYGVSSKVTAKLNDSVEAYAEFNFIQTKSSYTGSPASLYGTAPAGINYPRFATSSASSLYAAGSGVLAMPIYVCARAAGVSATLVNGVATVPGCTATTPGATLNPNNPYAASGQVARIVGRDLQSTTYNETRNRIYRGAFGVSGKLNDAITFDIGGTAMHDDLKRTYKGYVYIQHLLDVVADGTYNFINPSATPQSVVDYLKPVNIGLSSSDQVQLQASLNAKVADLPGGPLQVAVGGSERYEAVDNPSSNPDYNGPAQRYFTINAFGTKGSRWITSAYGELSAPIVKGVELSAAGRYDRYSTGQSSFSPKAGLLVKPFKQLMLRGTWSRGFRIPAFGETNSIPTTGYVSNTSAAFTDSFLSQYGCTKATFASCPAYIRSGSYGLTTTSNANLQPEKSRSFTLGAVFEPIRNVSFTVDFYDIKKTNVITTLSAGPALAAYYAGTAIPAGTIVIPDAVDPNYPTAKPKVGFVQTPYVNAASQVARGIDFGAEIKHRFSPDLTWSSSFDASYIILLAQDNTNVGGTYERYDGTIGNYNLTAGTGTPKWKGFWMNTFDYKGKLKVTTTFNYYGGYNLSAQDQGTGYMDCGLASGYNPGDGCNVKSYITADLNIQVKVNDQFTVYGTMNNVFDRMPPIDTVTYGAHEYNAVQGGNGILGRYLKVGAKVNF